MSELNNVNIYGRLVRDPELRFTKNETSVCNFCIANNRDKDNADFFNVVAWKGTAELVSKYLKKGSAVIIGGRLKHKTWTTQNGEKKNTVEIEARDVQFVGSRRSEQSDSQPDSQSDFPDFGEE